MSKTSRNKGKVFERLVARRLREILTGVNVRRGWQADGRETPDVLAGPFSVECKHRKSPNVRAAMVQAEEMATKGTFPVAWVRWDRRDRDDKGRLLPEDELVALRPDDFLELVEQWWKGVNA